MKEKTKNALVVLISILILVGGVGTAAYYLHKIDAGLEKKQAALEETQKRIKEKQQKLEAMKQGSEESDLSMMVDLKILEQAITDVLKDDPDVLTLIRAKYKQAKEAKKSIPESFEIAMTDKEAVQLVCDKTILAMKDKESGMTEDDIRLMTPLIMISIAQAL